MKLTSLEDFEAESNRIAKKYAVDKVQAECYLCNYCDAQICKPYYDRCEHIFECEVIHKKENKKGILEKFYEKINNNS